MIMPLDSPSSIFNHLRPHIPAQGGEFVPNANSAGDTTAKLLRNRSTRQLWDSTYVSESWIGSPVFLIPRMKDWVERYYPNTQTALTEYSWGGDDSSNGATAQVGLA
jgi:hypothetical protein